MSGNHEYIIGDTYFGYPVRTPDGNASMLQVSLGHDVLHHFEPLGLFVLKYWDGESAGTSNLLIPGEHADSMIHTMGLPVVEREHITEAEHNQIINYQASFITDSMFDIENIPLPPPTGAVTDLPPPELS